MFNTMGSFQSCPYLRTPHDTIPSKNMFVYKYFQDNLLSFVTKIPKTKDVPLPITKRILRDALRGLTTMHENNHMHIDVKPANIMINWEERKGNVVIRDVQLADLESAMYLPEGRVVDTTLVIGRIGEWMWRSPKAHLSSYVYQPSNIFPFGMVARSSSHITITPAH
jgi:serine/threonine protein kinase